MTDEPISWSTVFALYWATMWRTVLMYLGCMLPVNAVYLWLIMSSGLEERDLWIMRLVVAWLIILGASFVALRMALRKRHYHGFRIQIIREPVS